MKERGNKLLKFLDFYFGIPLVFILGVWRLLTKIFSGSKALSATSIKSIICMKTAAIGDTVILSGLLRDLRNNNPGLKIILAVGSSNAEIAKLLLTTGSNESLVDQVLVLPMAKPLQALRHLRNIEADAIFDFDSWPRINSVLCFFSKTRLRVGFKTEGQFRHYSFDYVISHSSEIHEIENYRNLVHGYFKLSQELPDLSFITATAANGENKVANLVLHLWSGGSQAALKEWPQRKWIEMLEIISESSESLGNIKTISISGGPGDFDKNKSFIESIPAQLKSHFQFQNCAGFELRKSLELFSSAGWVVSVDTGVAHLAAALGVKTVVLYGPTSPKRWGALGADCHWIVSSHKDAGKMSLGFEATSSANILQAIEATEVVRFLV